MPMPLVHPKWRWLRRLRLGARAAAALSILRSSSTLFSLGWPTWPIRFMLDRMRTHRRPAAGVVVVGSVDLHRVVFTIHGEGGLLAVAVQYAEESEEEEEAEARR